MLLEVRKNGGNFITNTLQSSRNFFLPMVPKIKVPKIKVPKIKVPKIKVPKIKVRYAGCFLRKIGIGNFPKKNSTCVCTKHYIKQKCKKFKM